MLRTTDRLSIGDRVCIAGFVGASAFGTVLHVVGNRWFKAAGNVLYLVRSGNGNRMLIDRNMLKLTVTQQIVNSSRLRRSSRDYNESQALQAR